MFCWFRIRWTEEQIHRQISLVDCSYISLSTTGSTAGWEHCGQLRIPYIVTLLWLPEANVLRC